MASKFDFRLPEQLTIVNVNSLCDALHELISKQNYDKLVIKADQVQRADTAGLQLMLSFVFAAREQHIDLIWSKPSKKLQEAAAILGLQQALGIIS